MADLNEISACTGCFSPRAKCTPKCPGVHAEAEAFTGSSGWFRRSRWQKTHQSQAWSVHVQILRKPMRSKGTKQNCHECLT